MAVSPVGPSSPQLTWQHQDSWRNLRGVSGASLGARGRRLTGSLLFEVTDASVVQDSSSKYVVSSNCQILKKKDRQAVTPPSSFPATLSGKHCYSNLLKPVVLFSSACQ